MAKKQFSTGMEWLFSEAAEDVIVVRTEEQANNFSNLRKKRKETHAHKKMAHGKTFMQNLNSFLEEALIDNISQKLDNIVESTTDQEPMDTIPGQSEPAGLDALIRSTIAGSEFKMDPRDKSRFTIVFEKDKLEKLRTIAKIEKKYIKDIVSAMVAEFILRYEKEKGSIRHT